MADMSVDRKQLRLFVDVVFDDLEGQIPFRGFSEPETGRVFHRWVPIAGDALHDPVEELAEVVQLANNAGYGCFVIPGTVPFTNMASTKHVQQMRSVLIDIDEGDVEEVRAACGRVLGPPTLTVLSGGLTKEGLPRYHLHYKLD